VDQDLARPQRPRRLGIEEDPKRGAVLDRAAGVIELELGVELDTGRQVVLEAAQPMKGRVAHQITDALDAMKCTALLLRQHRHLPGSCAQPPAMAGTSDT